MYCSAQSHTNGNWHSHSFQPYFQILLTDLCQSFACIIFSSPASLPSWLLSCYVAKNQKRVKKMRKKAAQNAPVAAQSLDRYLIDSVRTSELYLPSVRWGQAKWAHCGPCPTDLDVPLGILHLRMSQPWDVSGPPGWEAFVCPCQRLAEWSFCAVLENHSCPLDLQACCWTPSSLSGTVGFCNTKSGVSSLLSWPVDASPSLRVWVGICYGWLCTQTGHSLMGRLNVTSTDAAEYHGCSCRISSLVSFSSSFQESILASYLQNVPLS